MRRPALYSASRPPTAPTPPGEPPTPAALPEAAVARGSRPGAWARRLGHPATLWGVIALLAAAVLALGWRLQHAPAPLTQKAIDQAVLRTLSTEVLPSPQARAAAAVAPSVVHVQSLGRTAKGQEVELGVGTGVVIVDKGLILTNLHVVQGSRSVRLTFADGTESGASVVGARPEQDLAVLQAHTVPDDLKAATMRSTDDLLPGDAVVAVGFPFGIGPSVSAGVVSGKGRSFRSPEGQQEIGNLIQFDAAANPGNSGGPLVTLDGAVVGIVTGILNPTSHKTFLGIGFAVPIESAATAAGLPPF